MMTLADYVAKRYLSGMTVVSDVDGVHTKRTDGAKLTIGFDESGFPAFKYADGTRVFELVPVDPALRQTMVLAQRPCDVVAEFYTFYTPDGQAIQNLLKSGVRVVIVSGRDAAPVADRFGTKLYAEIDGQIVRPIVSLGVKEKLPWAISRGFDLRSTIFIGDGAQDAPLLQAVHEAGGIAVATADAESEAIEAAGVQTTRKGGEGAFAELVAVLLSFIEH